MLGLHCFGWAFSSCGEWGLLFVTVHRLLTVVASLLWSMGSRHTDLSSCCSPALELGLSGCGTRAYLLCGMWDLPRPGMEPESPALAGRFLFTAPRGKSKQLIFVSVSLKYSSFTLLCEGFPGGSDGKKSACSAGDPGSIPGSGRSPGEGNSYPLQYSCLENSVVRPWGCKEPDTTERLTLKTWNTVQLFLQLFAGLNGIGR